VNPEKEAFGKTFTFFLQNASPISSPILAKCSSPIRKVSICLCMQRLFNQIKLY